MAVQSWLHCVVSVDCGEALGSFQGRISRVDDREQTISLVGAFRNGLKCLVPEITIGACDIQHLEILSEVGTPEAGALTTNGNTTNDGEDYATNNGHHSHNAPSSPMKNGSQSRNRTNSESRQKNASTPRKGETRRKQPNHATSDPSDDCLNTPISSDVLSEDFDFEKNLALFDKQAIFKKLDAANKPDIVRLVDHNRAPPSKYRFDEQVLEQAPTVYRQIQVPQPGKLEFVTDMGLVVPSISLELRNRLLQTAEQLGFSRQRQLELMGRSASDMVLQLVGGSHRLNPRNAHQIPSVTLLCGPCEQGVQALNCGRHLANHGVRVTAYVPSLPEIAPSLASGGDAALTGFLAEEIALFQLSDGKLTSATQELSQSQADIILYALDGHQSGLHTNNWHRSAVEWAASSRAPVVAVDPPVGGVPLVCKWSVVPALPLDLRASATSSVGGVYLLDLAIPRKVFAKVGIGYRSPFGPKCVIPLHMSSGV